MKIATWNLERPTKAGSKLVQIEQCLRDFDFDILVATETSEYIELGSQYEVRHSEKDKQGLFRDDERRVSIFSKFPIIKEIKTFRADTSLCLSIDTPKGHLIVYGTVIGNRGNRGNNFKEDLVEQLADFKTIGHNANICVAGDFNISFSDNYYFTKEGRLNLQSTFQELGMIIGTADIKENIDHIVIKNEFIKGCEMKYDYWNDTSNKKERLSDHKGVFIEII